eukprot:g3922.t1
MGVNYSMQLQPDEVAELVEVSGFSREQVLRLYTRFRKLDRSNRGSIDQADLLKIPELAMSPVAEVLVDRFFRLSATPDRRVNFRKFLDFLGIFTGSSSLDARIQLLFSLYDISDDGYISEDELQESLRRLVGPHISDRSIADVVRRTIQEYDRDGDNRLSFEEFKEAILRTDIEEIMVLQF